MCQCKTNTSWAWECARVQKGWEGGGEVDQSSPVPAGCCCTIRSSHRRGQGRVCHGDEPTPRHVAWPRPPRQPGQGCCPASGAGEGSWSQSFGTCEWRMFFNSAMLANKVCLILTYSSPPWAQGFSSSHKFFNLVKLRSQHISLRSCIWFFLM